MENKLALSDLQKEYLSFLKARWTSAQPEADYMKLLTDRCYKLWFRWRKKRTKATARKSRLFIPMIFNMIETLLPLMVLTLFSVRKFLDVLPAGLNDQKIAKKVRDFMAIQIPRIPRWFLKACRWIKSCLMYGTGIIKPYWIDERYETPVVKNHKVAGVK